MNVVILTGNLTRDPIVTKTSAGVPCASGSIAVKRDYKNQNGDYETDFIDFVAYRAQAEYLAEYAKKGGRVEIHGSWRTRKFTDQSGNNRIANDVEVDAVTYFPKNENAIKGGKENV